MMKEHQICTQAPKASLIAAVVLSISLLPTVALAQTPAPITIPAGLTGTFELSMETNDSAFPISDSSEVLLSLSSSGALCADGISFSAPYTKTGSSNIFWTSQSIGLEISLLPSLPFSSFGVTNTDTSTTGTLTGERIAGIVTDCGQYRNYEEFFALAESVYPELFRPGALVFSRQDVSGTYRYYPATGVTLRLSGGNAQASGGAFGASAVTLGKVTELTESNLDDLPIPLSVVPDAFDDYYSGTYQLTFANATSFSPVANGGSYTFVITKDRELCVGQNVHEAPLYRAGGNGTVIWGDAEGDYYYALPLIPDSLKESQIQTGALSFHRYDGVRYGDFTGQRIALSAECPDAQGEDPDLAEINLLLDLAEQQMPKLFPRSPANFNKRENGYVYRHYEESGISIRVKDRRVEGKGGDFGGAYTFLGKLDKLLEMLRSTSLSIAMPSELVGTYTTTFSSSGSWSPLADGTSLDFAIQANGSICIDGNVLSNPKFDVSNRQLLTWTDSNAGIKLQLDITDPSPAGFQMELLSMNGLALGTLAGNKSLLLAECAGLLAGNIPVDSANTLFELAERYFPSQFPPSALTYNQFDGESLTRYYPGSKVMVQINGQQVSIKGGVYGSSPVALGAIDSLISSIRSQQGLEQLSTLLEVSGTMQIAMGNINVDKKYSVKKEGQAFPADTTDASLQAVMRQILGAELNGQSSFVFTIVTNTESAVVFDAQIVNSTEIAQKPVRRTYNLRVSFTKK